MEQIFITHFKPWLPYLSAVFGFAVAMFIAMKYKIPDLARRMGKVEKVSAGVQDLDRAIDSFHTVCRFNQVSCQKELELKQSALVKELDAKLSGMHEKLNDLAVSNAALAAQVELLVAKESGNANH